MSCECASSDGDGCYKCGITGDECLFSPPNSAACAILYEDGPEADRLDEIVLICDSCGEDFSAEKAMRDNGVFCPLCGGTNICIRSNIVPIGDLAEDSDFQAPSTPR